MRKLEGKMREGSRGEGMRMQEVHLLEEEAGAEGGGMGRDVLGERP